MSRVKSRYLILKALLVSSVFGKGAAAAAERGELDAWIAANRMGSTDAYQSFLESTRTAPSPRTRSRRWPTPSKGSPRRPAAPQIRKRRRTIPPAPARKAASTKRPDRGRSVR